MPTVLGVALLVVGLLVVGLLGIVARQQQLDRRRTVDRIASARAELDGVRQDAAAARIAARQIESEAEAEAERLLAKARTESEAEAVDIRRAAEEQARVVRESADQQVRDVERRERRAAERETRLQAESRDLSERALGLDERVREAIATEGAVSARRAELADLEAERRAALERVAGLSASAARAELIQLVETDAKRQAAARIRDLEQEAELEGERRAREIVVTAIQRVATPQTSEAAVSVLHLPSDEMKGRIIGREGRNIKAFEHATGVNLIIDETPATVVLSCFDPIRRESARHALQELIADGRIHPQRIEEVCDRSVAEVGQRCVRAGEEALLETGVTDLHPELVRLLGALTFRTSYGQNVLAHLVESAQLAGLMAAELGVDSESARRCALLHDIGKALTHQAEGSHAQVGADLARRHGESDAVVHAIEAHHNDVEPRSVDAVLTQAADAISGGRPGARRESLESYVRRLERLEEIARSQPGVQQVYAMQAGREVRVMVLPDIVDDIGAQVLARDIARSVEDELTYPGQIRITVVRESRATGIAA